MHVESTLETLMLYKCKVIITHLYLHSNHYKADEMHKKYLTEQV